MTSLRSPHACTRCALRPRVPGQRWCRQCRAAYKRKAGTPGNTTGNTAFEANDPPGAEKVVPAGPAQHQKASAAPPARPVEPPAPYVPFDGLEPDPSAPPREPWYSVFLCELAERGLMALAAARASVHISKVYRRRDADQDFAEEIEVARAYYADHLEWESVTLGRIKGNPLPYFARLKAERPARYIDRQAVLLATGGEFVSSEDGRALLLAMFGQNATALTEDAGLRALPARSPE